MEQDEYRRRFAEVLKLKAELRQGHAALSLRRNELATCVMATDRAVRAYRRAVANVARTDTEQRADIAECERTLRRVRMAETTARANVGKLELTLRRAEDAVRKADIQFQIDSADAEGERPPAEEPR